MKTLFIIDDTPWLDQAIDYFQDDYHIVRYRTDDDVEVTAALSQKPCHLAIIDLYFTDKKNSDAIAQNKFATGFTLAMIGKRIPKIIVSSVPLPGIHHRLLDRERSDGHNVFFHWKLEGLKQLNKRIEEVLKMPNIDPGDPKRRNVFVVYGRNLAVRDAMFAFLQKLDLKPIEWEVARKETGKPNPYIGDILAAGLSMAQACLILLTPDEEVRLRGELRKPNDNAEFEFQPRANVIFEAGMAWAQFPDQTVLVEVGTTRIWSDIHGLYVPGFDGTAASRHALAQRLKDAGCAVNTDGVDWLRDNGEFKMP